jgi:hypothetical protein
VLFGDEFPQPLAVYKLPLGVVKQFAFTREHRRVLVLAPSVVNAPGVEDLTPRFRQDGASALVKLPTKLRTHKGGARPEHNPQGVRELGVGWVTAQLTKAGFQVTTENSTRLRVSGHGVHARLVRVISASGRIFSLRRKFAATANLLLVYVCHVQQPEKTLAFTLTYPQALAIANAKGWTKTKSWLEDGHYYDSHIGDELMQMLKPYEVMPQRWAEAIAANR